METHHEVQINALKERINMLESQNYTLLHESIRTRDLVLGLTFTIIILTGALTICVNFNSYS